jgi:hypothetical protein
MAMQASGLPGSSASGRQLQPNGAHSGRQAQPAFGRQVQPASGRQTGNSGLPLRQSTSSSGPPRQPNSEGRRDYTSNTPYQHPSVDSVSESRKTLDTCHQVLNELRRGLDEQRKVKEDVRRIGQVMGRLEESMKELSEALKHHTRQSFTIETSAYKVSN